MMRAIGIKGKFCTVIPFILLLCSSSVLFAQISTFPYSESFENTFGSWTFGSGDDMDWVNWNAAAPSGGTGPSAASAGSYYLYTEASLNGATNAVVDGNPEKRAYLEATFDFTGEFNPTLSFDYHMFGADIGSLHVDVYDGVWNNNVWSLAGEQQTADTDPWRQAVVDLSAYENRNDITIRFRGVTGNDYQSDIAIDNVSVCTVAPGTAVISSNMNCSGSTTETLTLTGYDSGTITWQRSTDNITFADAGLGTTDSESTGVLSSSNTYYYRAALDNGSCTAYSNVVSIVIEAANSANNTFPYSEGFETDFGIWTNAAGDDIDWTRDDSGTPSNYTGPMAANGGITYIYTEASGNFNSNAYLETTFDFSTLGDPQLIIPYHMFGSDMGTLSIDVGADTDVWSISGEQQGSHVDAWKYAYIDLSAYGGYCNVTIRLMGATGTDYKSDMALDDLIIWDSCPSVNGGTASISETLLCAAGAVDLSVVGQDGGATLQWQQSTDNVNFSAIGGATSANYTTATLSTGSTYYFRAELTNVCVNYSDTVAVVVNAGGGGISAFPYAEDLESGLGSWTNATGDDFDWTLNTGGTATANTGPSAGNGGSGQYIYTEADGNNPLRYAYLEADFDFTGITQPIFSFYYHMYGDKTGTIYLDANGTNVGSIAYEQQTSNGAAWEQASFDLSDYAEACSVTLRLRGETGEDELSDMAVDDLSLCTVAPGTASISENSLCAAGTVTLSLADYDASGSIQWEESTDNVLFTNLTGGTSANQITGSLSVGNTYYFRAAVTNTCTTYSNTVSVIVTSGSGESTFPYAEDFESGIGIWTQSASDDFDWTTDYSGQTPSTGTGPSGAYEGNQYIYTEASGANSPSKETYLEATFDFTSAVNPELSFFYHMFGDGMGSLYVDANGTNVWSISGQQQTSSSDDWAEATIDLSDYDGVCSVTLRFRAVTGGDFDSDIAIDDVNVCTKPQTSAISGNSDVCTGDTGESYSVTNNAGNTYSWVIVGGSANPSSTSNAVTIDWGSTGKVGSVSVRERSGECKGSWVAQDINIHTLPTSAISGSTSLPVSSQDKVYTVDDHSGYTYAWTINGGTADPASTSNAVNVDWDATAETVSLSVIATDAGRGCTATSSVSIDVTKYDIITSNGIGGGDWNNTATWSCACIPLSTQSVQILNGDVVTLAQAETVANLIIDAGGEVDNSTFVLTVDSDYIINGTHAGTGNINLAGSDTNIDGTGSITNTGALQISGGNKTILSSANVTKSAGDVNITASNIGVTNSGALTISSGSLNGLNGTDSWTNTASSALSVSGNIMITGGSLNASATGNTITYGVAGAQTIKTPNSSRYYNLVIATSGVKSLNGNIIVQNDLTISDAAELDMTASNYDITIHGNWTNTSSNTLIERAGAVNFVGTSGDQIISNTSGETFFDMNVNKSSGDVLLAANTNIAISGALAMSKGLIKPNADETVTLNDDATASSTTSSYVDGKVIKVGNDAFVFPIGKSGGRGPVGISAPATVTSSFEAEYFQTSPGNTSSLTGLNHISSLEYWEINETTGSGDAVAITLYWDSGTRSKIIQEMIDDADLVVAHWNGSSWVNEGGAITGTQASGATTSGAVSSFSPFTFATLNEPAGLPVELTYFKAVLQDQEVLLIWETASELNNDRFEIEKSMDGVDYETIGSVEGHGTINTPKVYKYVDRYPNDGISYYRLRQIDYDGQFEVFDPVSIHNSPINGRKNILLYPNPTHQNNINIRFVNGVEKSHVMINIYDLAGHLVHSEIFEPSNDTSTHSLIVNGKLETGIYQVFIKQRHIQEVTKLIIK